MGELDHFVAAGAALLQIIAVFGGTFIVLAVVKEQVKMLTGSVKELSGAVKELNTSIRGLEIRVSVLEATRKALEEHDQSRR